MRRPTRTSVFARSTSHSPLSGGACGSFELGRACPPALWALAGVATERDVRSTSALRNVSTRAPVLRRVPSSAFRRPCGFRARLSRTSLFATPCRRNARRLSRVRRHETCVMRGATWHAGGLGPGRRETRLGRSSLHGALLTSAPGRPGARTFSFLVRESIPFASGTPVASLGLVRADRRFRRAGRA